MKSPTVPAMLANTAGPSMCRSPNTTPSHATQLLGRAPHTCARRSEVVVCGRLSAGRAGATVQGTRYVVFVGVGDVGRCLAGFGHCAAVVVHMVPPLRPTLGRRRCGVARQTWVTRMTAPGVLAHSPPDHTDPPPPVPQIVITPTPPAHARQTSVRNTVHDSHVRSHSF